MTRRGKTKNRIKKTSRKSNKQKKTRTGHKAPKLIRSQPKKSVAITKQGQAITVGERLHQLLTATSVVVYASKCSGDYTATFISDNAKRLTGYNPRSFIRKPSFWIDHVHPDDRARVLKEVPRVLKRGYYEYEYRFKHKNGKYMWMHDEMALICDKIGKPVEIVGYWTDVTRRRQMEDDIHQRLQRISDFMESATEGFVLLDSEFNVVDVNSYLLDQFGWKIEDARRVNILDLSTQLWESGRFEKYQEVLETGRPCVFEDVMTPARFGDKHLNLFAFRAGDHIGLVVQDITGHKKAQQKLLESEERLRSLYDSITAGIIVHDLERVVVSANKRACEILDLAEDEIIGADVVDLCSNAVDEKGNRIAPEEHPLAETFRTACPVRNRIVGIPSDDPAKKTWLLINTEPVFDPETKKLDEVLCTFIDITEQKNIEDALEESEARYRHLFENSPFGIGIAAMDGKVITANKAMLEIMGYSLDEARKINIADTYVSVDDRRRLVQDMNQYGRVTNYHVRLKRKDGTIYDAVLDISRINLAGKDYLHTICRRILSKKSN